MRYDGVFLNTVFKKINKVIWTPERFLEPNSEVVHATKRDPASYSVYSQEPKEVSSRF